ncbi:sodium solute symporter [Aureococcus anophagefferens]|nr:sodium solute symporter [Aureococcus anophagefferens]
MSGRLLQEAQPYTVPEGGAMGILFGGGPPGDGFLSGQSAWYSIALSFFASGMGAWIVYGTTEMARRGPSRGGRHRLLTAPAFPRPPLLARPRIKTVVGAASGFSATDFALSRYGRLMHLHVCCISCFYMYIYMVAELTPIGNAYHNGIASVLSRDLLKQKLNTNWSPRRRRLQHRRDHPGVGPLRGRALFLVADLVCATAVFPLFLGLWTDDLVVGPLTIPAPTELGAFLGALAGIAAVMVNGEINDVNKAVNPYTGKVYDKSAFAYFWGINSKSDGSPYERSAARSSWSPSSSCLVVSAAATVIFSYVDVYVGGDKAKQPFIIVPRLDGDDDALLPAKDLELDAIQVADDDKKSPDEELTFRRSTGRRRGRGASTMARVCDVEGRRERRERARGDAAAPVSGRAVSPVAAPELL